MTTLCTHRHRLARLARAFSFVTGFGAIAAATALAATATPSLKIKVPARVRPKETYKIVLSVTYAKSTLHTTPYLVSYLQFNGAPCKPTAGAEHALGGGVAADFIGKVPNSPFVRTDRWRAGTLTGARRVCAYLYPRRVSQRTKAKPLLSAGRLFRNL
jgi:hypothetical protein